ncbi:MAG: ribonuclease HII [Thermomicrobiales bacterium]
MDLIQQLEYEMALWQAGMHVLAGIDEAGRGALAGPLVAAAVCCDDDRHVERVAVFETAHLVRDSKTLSAKQRRAARDFICEAFGNCGVGIVSSEEIDFFGIVAANRLAMERAVDQLSCVPEFLLIDAFTIDSGIPQWGIIDGDARSFLISAASIIAKVTRDEIMDSMMSLYREYSFDRHRGYGTSRHLEELDEYGPCPIHRRSFSPVSGNFHTGGIE